MKVKYDIDRNAVFPNLERHIKSRYGNYSAYARKTGLHRTTIRDIITGVNTPRWDIMLLILDDTGMTFEECFGGKKHV
jgi:DNA-binding phage protein